MGTVRAPVTLRLGSTFTVYCNNRLSPERLKEGVPFPQPLLIGFVETDGKKKTPARTHLVGYKTWIFKPTSKKMA